MKIPDYPGPGLRTTTNSGGHRHNNNNQGQIINDRLAGPARNSPQIPSFNARPESPLPEADKSGFLTAVLKRQAYDDLCKIKDSLLMTLEEKALPKKFRERWIRMLSDVDFVSTNSGKDIERLCRECTAARCNIERLLRHEVNSVERRKQVDTELVMIYNGLNNIANQWWLYKSFPG